MKVYLSVNMIKNRTSTILQVFIDSGVFAACKKVYFSRDRSFCPNGSFAFSTMWESQSYPHLYMQQVEQVLGLKFNNV